MDVGLIIQHLVLEEFKVIYVQYTHIITAPPIRYYIKATIHSDSAGYFVSASNMGIHSEYIHNSRVDGDTKHGGTECCFLMRSLVGGSYGGSTVCGSRGIHIQESPAYIHPPYS